MMKFILSSLLLTFQSIGILIAHPILLTAGQTGQRNSIADIRTKALAGDAEGQFNLAGCYGLGQGVPQDFAETVRWARKAAQQGHAGAQHLLGVCYGLGKGVSLDYTQAAKWYRKSAVQGNALGQYCLAVCFAEGKGVSPSYSEAYKWARKSADQDNPEAQFLLAGCYALGRGVHENFEEAYVWSSIAAVAGHKNSPKFRDMVATKLSPQAIERAQARARKMAAEILARKQKS